MTSTRPFSETGNSQTGDAGLKDASFVSVSMKVLSLRGYLQQAAVNEGGQNECQVVVHQIRPKGDESRDIPHSHLFLILIPFH